MVDGSATWQEIGLGPSKGNLEDWQIVGTGNFNGDENGTDDILWYNTATHEVGLYVMDTGTPTWQEIGSAPSEDWQIVGTGDFNGDGTDDILWRDTVTQDVELYVMDEVTPTWQEVDPPGDANWIIA
jgi:hypothetical protein